MNFYYIFLELCNEMGKSPSRVALEIGASKPAVTRWKSGSKPSDAVLLKLAAYFNVSIEYLKGETNEKRPLGNNAEESQDERLNILYELTKELNDNELLALKSFVAGLKANRKQD